MILLHDDMGSQKAPFFSPALFRELFLPQYQKITKAAHEMGMFITLHSCGNVGLQIPNFIEAGFDAWQGQNSANDKEALMEQYHDQLFQDGHLMIGADVSDEDAIAMVHDFVDGIGKYRRILPGVMDMKKNRSISVEDEFYRYTRKLYSK